MYFYGDLVRDKELAKVARQRRKPYYEVTVSQAERDAYLARGWTVERELKTRVRLRKQEQRDEALEDEV